MTPDYDSPWKDLLDRFFEEYEELERNPSVFAIVVMAHLRTIETRHSPQRRMEWKLTLTRMLYERGYNERTIIDLFRFPDWLMFLPGELQRGYRDEIERYEEEKKMPYVTTIERMGIEKGRVEGRVEATTDLLQQKFGALDEQIESRLRELTYEQLKQLTTVLLKLNSLDELRNWLQQLNELPLQA